MTIYDELVARGLIAQVTDEEEIKELKKHRGLIRDRRKKDGVITAALVGYTNAGKSTL